MTVDITNMNLSELMAHRADVDRAIAERMEHEKSQVMADMKALAEERGFDFNDLMGAKKKERKRAAAKYQNPENLKQTWSGMGRQPNWIKDYLAAGKSLEELEIK